MDHRDKHTDWREKESVNERAPTENKEKGTVVKQADERSGDRESSELLFFGRGLGRGKASCSSPSSALGEAHSRKYQTQLHRATSCTGRGQSPSFYESTLKSQPSGHRLHTSVLRAEGVAHHNASWDYFFPVLCVFRTQESCSNVKSKIHGTIPQPRLTTLAVSKTTTSPHNDKSFHDLLLNND